MAFGTITSTSNTFGSVDGTATGVVPGTLSGSIGVPGPQGPAGPTGPAGAAGQGVPAGGDVGQFLKKTGQNDYVTGWGDVDISGKRDLTDYDFTNVADEKLNVYGLTINPLAGTTIPYDSYLNDSTLRFSYDASNGGTVEGVQSFCQYTGTAFVIKRQDWTNVDGDMVATLQYGASFDPTNGLKFINWNGTTQASTMQYGRTSITFPNASVQTIAFPGFANAALTGNSTAVTAALGDNDTSIATTAFVQQELLSGTANARNLEVQVRNQSGSTVAAGSIVYISGATGNLPLITKAQANNDANSAQTIGFVKTSIANNGTGYVIVRGVLENIDTSALTEGVQLYLSPSTAGTWTTTKPSAPQHLVYVGVVIRSHPTLGTILVSVQNGYELHELHDVALSSLANNDLLVYELSTDLWKNKSFATLGLLTSSTAASTYAPLASPTFTGTVTIPAGASISGFAPLASPTFTGTPSLPTGTTAVTQSAGNNTTALATTAFVTAAVPAFATDAQAIAGTSATTIINPADYRVAGLTTNIWAPGYVNLAAGTSGTGSATGASSFTLSGTLTAPNASTAGYATRGFLLHYPSNGGTTSYNFSTASGHAMRFYSSSLGSTIAGVKARAVFGRTNVLISAASTLAVRGYGWEWDFSTRTMNIIAHNGTTLTTTAVTWNPSGSRTYEVVATSDGAGTISLYVDGTLLGTSSGGPTGLINVGSNFLWWQAEVQNEATAGSQVSVQLTNPKVYTTNG